MLFITHRLINLPACISIKRFLSLSLVEWAQAKKKRKLIENGGVVVEKKEVDGRVIQSQPLPEAFPTPEARKEYFNRTYQVEG